MDEYGRAAGRFRLAQEKLKAFIEENMEFRIDGLQFVNERDSARLDREYAALKAEHDEAGRLWALTLTLPSGKMTATASTVLQMTASGSTLP